MSNVLHIIFGIPLVHPEGEKVEYSDELSQLIYEADEQPPAGVLSYYEMGPVRPAAFGVELATITQDKSFQPLPVVAITPNAEQMDQYLRAWDALSPELQEEISKFGEPLTITMWSHD